VYDFWFTLGVTIMRPALLDKISDAGPVFDFVDRIIIEVTNGQPALRPKAPDTGLLEKDPTTAVRLAISKFVRGVSAAAPPIGIYCAGRFCQLIKIPFFASAQPNTSSLRDIINSAHAGYLAALNDGPESPIPAFPAFLGWLLVDPALVPDFDSPTDQVKEVASEFGVVVDDTNRSWQIARTFVKTNEFLHATQLLMVADNSPWKSATAEQIIFWTGLSEHAIP
jgi:hypothetical protein